MTIWQVQYSVARGERTIRVEGDSVVEAALTAAGFIQKEAGACVASPEQAVRMIRRVELDGDGAVVVGAK